MQNMLIAKYLEKLEREITKTNSLMKETKSLLHALKNIEEHASRLEELSTKNEKLREMLKSELKNKNLGSKIKTLEKELLELQRILKEKEEPTLKLDVLLENLRVKAEYEFEDWNHTKEFLISCFKELKEKKIKFRPRIFGITSLDAIKPLANSTKNQWFILHLKKLQRLLTILQKYQHRQFIFSGEKIKIVQNNNRLCIFADTETLNFLDSVAKIHNAKILA